MSQLGQGPSKTLTVFGKDLGPWTPDIDPRRNEKPGIISCSNIIDDIDGPRSAFSTNFADFNYWDPTTRGKVTELRVANGMLYGTGTGVWYVDNVSGIAIPLLIVTVTNTKWPWTIALVGGFYYLAQYDIGLWQYDPVNLTIEHVVTPAGDTIRGVNSSFGRLIYLTDTVLGVSAQDDGTNLTPSLTTAASAQALSLVPGTALKIEAIPDGFLVYFTGGIMKGTFTQQQYIFQYTKLTEGVRVFSPNATVYIPRIGALSLDASGFNLTREWNYQDYGIPQPWEITMGDYIKKNILIGLNTNLYGTVDMYFSIAEQKIFISFSSNSNEGLMVKCFVYSLVNKKWGSFDHNHTGIFETFSPMFSLYTCSYMADDGYIREFSNTDFSEGLPNDTNNPVMLDYLFRPTWEEIPVFGVVNAAGTPFYLVTTDIKGSDNNPNFYSAFTATGTYQINYIAYSDTDNDDTPDPAMIITPTLITVGTYITTASQGACLLKAITYNLPEIGLNSSLEIGPFRFTDEAQSDEVSAISTVMLGLASASNFSISEDWNSMSGSADWNTLTGTIDWGAGSSIPNTFSLTLLDSDDGFNAPIQGEEELEIFNDLGSALTYSPIGYSSVYHTLTLGAMNAGESFALKVADVTGLQAGRLLTM